MGLVLTRRVGETIEIGDDIEVTIARVKGNQVAIHIEAPRDMPVNRSEIAERIRREKENG